MTSTNGQAPSIAPPTHKLTRKEEATWPLTKDYGQLTSTNQRQPLVCPRPQKALIYAIDASLERYKQLLSWKAAEACESLNKAANHKKWVRLWL